MMCHFFYLLSPISLLIELESPLSWFWDLSAMLQLSFGLLSSLFFSLSLSLLLPLSLFSFLLSQTYFWKYRLLIISNSFGDYDINSSGLWVARHDPWLTLAPVAFLFGVGNAVSRDDLGLEFRDNNSLNSLNFIFFLLFVLNRFGIR